MTSGDNILTTFLDNRLLEMRAALETRGVAITAKRARLLEFLVRSEDHPSVSEIHDGVRRSFPTTSLATVYNTIELLKDARQVLEIEFSGAANRYDGRSPQPHPHIICLRCHRIGDLDLAEPSESLDAVSAATGYKVVHQRTDYYGVCPACQGDSQQGNRAG